MTKGTMKLAPLRSLDDFLLSSAKFQLPNYRDLEKWNNRVTQNLLYYETNYFLMMIFLILAVTLLHPLKMLTGALSVGVMYGLFYFINTTGSTAGFKKEHPFLGIFLIFSGACLVVYLLGSLLVFLFGILLPVSVTFIHASLRLRSIKNKVANMERVISDTTPMGVLLESLGTLVSTTETSSRLDVLSHLYLWFFSAIPISYLVSFMVRGMRSSRLKDNP